MFRGFVMPIGFCRLTRRMSIQFNKSTPESFRDNNSTICLMFRKIKTTNTFKDLDFQGNYSLKYICCNRSEIDFVTDKAVDYGLSNCRINDDCIN